MEMMKRDERIKTYTEEMKMMKRNRTALIFFVFLTLISPFATLAFAESGEDPSLILSRQANFREEGVRSGTLIKLFPDRFLEIYALGMLEDADEPVLVHAGSITGEEYEAVEQMLGDGDFLSLPEWIETGVLDGDTVVMTACTAGGEHTVSAYSPDGTPFGDMVQGIEALLGAHENQ